MAEPENFDDDLFADLYDDNDGPAAPAPAAPAVPAQPQPPASVAAPVEAAQPIENAAPSGENGYGDDYQDDNYEDDDDVAFDLGNGPTNSGPPAIKQDEDSAPSYHTSKGPSAKEDG
ncbi:hypothetical protein F5Y15DRAFT_194739 [Xylariaceae sp. FL0016]|nr:hypothetical protein F5Y15DRAFT_194739 [Xylariaceae sp. FL0016]